MPFGAPQTDQSAGSFPQPGQGQQGQPQAQPQQGQGGGDEDAAFEQTFSQSAQQMLLNKHPQLAQDVITFKVLNADIDKGIAVGSFVLKVNNQIIYVPAVLAENSLKPMELMYVKALDMFLPLSDGWIDEVSNNKVPQLGVGVKTPQSLTTDQDIRNLVVPPTTGRYSFASADNLRLPKFLEECGNHERALLRNTFLAHPDLLKTASNIYGYETIKHGLTPRTEKTADYGGHMTSTGALYIVDGKSDKANFKEIFGDETPAVMRGLAMEGFYSKDGRKKTNQAVNTEEQLRLTEAKLNGFYKVFTSDGKSETVLVVVNPINLKSDGHGMGGTNGFRYDTRPGNARAGGRNRFGDDGLEPKNENPTWQGDRSFHPSDNLPEQQYLCITGDRKFFTTEHPLVGSPATSQEVMGTDLAKMFGEKGDSPQGGNEVLFLRKRGQRFEATLPVKVTSTATDSMGTRRISCDEWGQGLTVVTDPKSPVMKITVPEGSNIAYVPADFSAYRVKRETEPSRFLRNPKDITSMFLDHFRGIGAHPVTIKEASDGSFYVNGSFVGDRVETIVGMAKELDLRVPTCVELVKAAEDNGSVEFMLIPADAFEALGQEMKKIASLTAAGGDINTAKPVTRGILGYLPGNNPGKPLLGRMLDQVKMGNLLGIGAENIQPKLAGDSKPKAEADAGQEQQDPHAQAMAQMQANGAMDPSQDPSQQPAQPDPGQLMQQAIQEVQDTVQKSMEMNIAELSNKQKALETQMAAMQSITQRMQELSQGIPKEQSQAIQSLEDTQDSHSGVDPAAMQSAAGTNDAQAFDTAAIASVVDHSKLHDLVSNYMPTLEQGLDHLGRILLSFWVESADLKPALGDQAYSDFEDRIRATFKGFGELLLRIERGAFDTTQQSPELASTN
jgi:hypothetical protein